MAVQLNPGNNQNAQVKNLDLGAIPQDQLDRLDAILSLAEQAADSNQQFLDSSGAYLDKADKNALEITASRAATNDSFEALDGKIKQVSQSIREAKVAHLASLFSQGYALVKFATNPAQPTPSRQAASPARADDQEKIFSSYCRHNGDDTCAADIVEHVFNGEIGSAARDVLESDVARDIFDAIGNEALRIED